MYYYHAGLVVPDVPLEETDILRSEAAKNNLELVGPLSCYGVHLILFYSCCAWTFVWGKQDQEFLVKFFFEEVSLVNSYLNSGTKL
jgi:hypothetical protein